MDIEARARELADQIYGEDAELRSCTNGYFYFSICTFTKSEEALERKVTELPYFEKITTSSGYYYTNGRICVEYVDTNEFEGFMVYADTKSPYAQVTEKQS